MCTQILIVYAMYATVVEGEVVVHSLWGGSDIGFFISSFPSSSHIQKGIQVIIGIKLYTAEIRRNKNSVQKLKHISFYKKGFRDNLQNILRTSSGET